MIVPGERFDRSQAGVAYKPQSRRTAEPQPAEPSPAPCSAYNHAEKDATKEGCECRKLSPAPSGDVIERIKAILAREFPALLILHDRLSKEICSVARADLLANPPQEWLDKRDAADFYLKKSREIESRMQKTFVEFGIVLSEIEKRVVKDHPELHFERKIKLVFRPTASAYAVEMRALDKIGHLTGKHDRDSQFEALCVDWDQEHDWVEDKDDSE